MNCTVVFFVIAMSYYLLPLKYFELQSPDRFDFHEICKIPETAECLTSEWLVLKLSTIWTEVFVAKKNIPIQLSIVLVDLLQFNFQFKHI